MSVVGPPRAIAPLDRVQGAVAYATRVIPPNKLLLGISLYGYDWPLSQGGAGGQGPRASSISNNAAQNLAISQQMPIAWDERAASPSFQYETSDGGRREVWFEDALSVAKKMDLVTQYRLRGLSYWVLPNSFPQNWYLLRDAFVIRRESQ